MNVEQFISWKLHFPKRKLRDVLEYEVRGNQIFDRGTGLQLAKITRKYVPRAGAVQYWYECTDRDSADRLERLGLQRIDNTVCTEFVGVPVGLRENYR